MKFGIIKEPKIWLYKTSQPDRADELFMGWAVGILETAEGWYKVITHYGYTGYVCASSVVLVTENELRNRDKSGLVAVICRGAADVLTEPKVQGEILATLTRGAFVRILPEAENGYRHVEMADGRQGYIPCIAYTFRKDWDGYLYTLNKKNFFIEQQCPQSREGVFRELLIRQAKSYLGTQYRWGGKSAEGLDCSGLTFMSYMLCGILIYRDAALKEGYPVHEIPLAQIKKGDLLYFPGHIAMYLGDGKYIHATGNAKSFGCVINSLCKGDIDFRRDLCENLYAAGSIWL